MYIYGILHRPIVYYINILNILSQVFFFNLKFLFILVSIAFGKFLESFYKFPFSQIN